MSSPNKGITLVPLKCPDCGVLLDKKGERFARCNACGVTYQVTRRGLTPVKLRTSRQDGQKKPFWVFRVKVKITHRDATGNIGSLIGKLAGDSGAEGEIRVFVPAYETGNIMNTAIAVTQAQPRYDVSEIGDVMGVVLTEDEAKRYLVPVIMGLEVKRKDTLHSIGFDIKVQEVSLDWVQVG